MSSSNSDQGNPNSKRSDSPTFEEIDSRDWAAKVYQLDIVRNSDRLYKKPGYTM